MSLAAVAMMAGCGGGGPTSAPHGTAPPRGGAAGGQAAGGGASGVRLERIGDFDQPVYVTQPPGSDNDLFVVEQTGRIEVVRRGRALPSPFLDLTGRVACCGEQGLFSMAFAPNYGHSGLVYVDYTNTAGDTRVVEYRRSSSSPLRADPATRRVVLRVHQPFTNHNGGLVLFGPDRLLYVGLGDGGSEGDPNRIGQDLSTPLGKILRIDPRPARGRAYSVPRSNPFTGRPGARPEIYAYGLRNPWRFSFDSKTGALAIGDVGQDRFEEVDVVRRGRGAGANFGWSAYEGFARYNRDEQAPNAVPPVLAYRHGARCSVTGGYVVRDRTLPSLYGRYLYGDYCSGELWSFIPKPGRRAEARPLGIRVPSLSSFGVDDRGHVYATSLRGPVYRLRPTHPAPTP